MELRIMCMKVKESTQSNVVASNAGGMASTSLLIYIGGEYHRKEH